MRTISTQGSHPGQEGVSSVDQDYIDKYPVRYEFDMAWGDMDAFGHVNNTKYFRYFETARILYFEKCGISTKEFEDQIGPILSFTNCKFIRPLYYPDKIWTGVRVKALGDDRFRMEHAVYSQTQNALAAIGVGDIVCFDYKSKKKSSVPKRWVSAMVEKERRTETELRSLWESSP